MTNPNSHRWIRIGLVGATLVGALGGLAGGGLAAGDGSATARPVGALLERAMPGVDALDHLGDRVGLAAARNGLDESTMRTVLADRNAWLDSTGLLLYADVDLPSAETGEGSGLSNSHNPARPASFPQSQTFTLHSLPGATKVAHLDFDGHTVSGTQWNTDFTYGGDFVAGPYDIDGDPGTFSAAEHAAIQEIWQRVSEDFAPLQIDVTTEAPAPDALLRTDANDQNFGTRILVSNTTLIYTACGCGGISYVSSYNWVPNHQRYQPAFVFQNGVGTSPKTIAEAASHELGHTLGLRHDETASGGGYGGHGAWAPIMGTGYSRPVTQWSRGEFAGSTNGEDDLTVMQSRGVPLAADDVGDSLGAALGLGAGGGRDGVITTAADRDVYSFSTAGGPVSITANPATVSPNLDIRLDLLDGAGGVITSANPPTVQVSDDYADGMGATIRTSVAPGTYYVVVDGAGNGDPATNGYSDYASLGRYRLTVASGSSANTPPTAVAAASSTSGRGPLTVTFSSGGSTDSDGSIVAYAWDFGDGWTSTEPNPTHTYPFPYDYPVRLTVTDDQGVSSTSGVTISVTDSGNRVSSLELSMLAKNSTRNYAGASVVMTSPSGGPLGRALVLGAWSGSDKRWVLGITDDNGVVTFDSLSASKSKASYGFTVLWAGYLEAPDDWTAAAMTSARVWNGGPQYWAASSPA